MKISSYNSQKIRVLSFVAIMMVLYIHACFQEAADFPIALYVQRVIQFSGLSFVANPLFFCISGFLFFTGVAKVSDCYPKIKKRAKTLLLPYVIWNIIFVLWYVVLGILPGVSQFVNSNVSEYFTGGLFGALDAFISPAAFQLWYLRDLIIYVLLSPLFYVCLKRFKWGLPLLLFIAGSLGIIYLPSEIKIWGAFFFVLGSYIALYSSLDDLKRRISPTMAYVCLAIYILNAVLRPLAIISLAGTDMIVELCGLIAIWRLYDVVVNVNSKFIKRLASWGSYSFFIYLFHEPAFNIIKKLSLRLCGANEFSLIYIYIY
jgi:fucose 4-O-acetylase-like acetyltransferase